MLTLAADANPNVAVAALALLWHFAASDREASRRLWSIALSGEGRRRQVALQSLAAALKSGGRAAILAAASSPDPFVRAAAAGGRRVSAGRGGWPTASVSRATARQRFASPTSAV